MTRLTDTQLVILSAAAARHDCKADQPAAMPDDVFAKAITQLKRRKLIVAADDAHVISEAGLQAIGAVDADGSIAADSSSEPSPEHSPTQGGTSETDAPVPRQSRKTDLLLELLRSEGGASIADITAATGWLPHSARAALTGLRKKGHDVQRESVEGVTRYRLVA